MLMLDSDATIGDNASTANAANFSLKKACRCIDGSIAKAKMKRPRTDASRGGIRHSLSLEMLKLGRNIDLALFLEVPYYLHAMNLMMRSPCEKCFKFRFCPMAVRLLCIVEGF